MAYSTTTVTTEVGKNYGVTADWQSSGGTWQVVAGTTAGASDLGSYPAAGSGSASFAFDATGTTTYISIVSVGEPFGEYVELDNVSVKENTGLIVYGGGVVINLPPGYYLTAGGQAVVKVVKTDGEVMTVASTTETTITVTEEFQAEDLFYIGIPYTMRYEMTEPILKVASAIGQGLEPVSVGRHQIRYMTVVYDETAFFKVRVTPEIGEENGTPTEYPYSGLFLATGGRLGSVPSSDGKFRFPVFAQSDAVKIEILNDTPFPSNIQSVTFEANYTSRSQRFS